MTKKIFIVPVQHIFYALSIAFIWGSNFVAIKLSYEAFTPFTLLTMRFLITAFPLVFFIKRPECSWVLLFKIAIFLWMGQFIFTFLAIYLGMPASIASLVLQVQAIFTIGLTTLIHGYRPTSTEVIGIMISLTGIALIAKRIEGVQNVLGFVFLLLAALSTSYSNLLYRGQTKLNPLGLIVWSSLIPPLPLIALSLLFEGRSAFYDAYQKITLSSSLSTLYTAYFSTVIAASLWAYLLRNHEPARIVPFGLLVPVFSMIAAYWVLNESITLHTLFAGSLIILGLLINQVLSPQIVRQGFQKMQKWLNGQ